MSEVILTPTFEQAMERWSAWPKKRQAAKDRDGHTCQDCECLVGPKNDEISTAEVHHLIPVSSGGSDDLDNLVTLCVDCHDDRRDEELVYPNIGPTDYRQVVFKHMAASDGESVSYEGRGLNEPTPNQIHNSMNECEIYNVSDLRSEFEDTSRWTIQRRLDDLVDQGRIQKKKHDNGNVSYWID